MCRSRHESGSWPAKIGEVSAFVQAVALTTRIGAKFVCGLLARFPVASESSCAWRSFAHKPAVKVIRRQDLVHSGTGDCRL
jgi:hypothetical protein